MQTSLLQSLLFAALATGCLASGQVGYTADVSVPEMVVVSPGVQVIANYDEPIFYNENYYWRNEGGFWYRSRTHSGGWVRYQAPSAILSIERPTAYVHYHGSAQVNEHRAPAPMVRDHREERHDAQDRRDDRRDQQKDQAEKRHDEEKRKDKEEKREDKKRKHD